MSEYPDHLNPFKDSEKKKLGTLSRSFRGFKGFIRQSFRKKKSKSSTNGGLGDIEIRKPQDFSYNTLRNNVMSMPSPPTYNTPTSPPLPRSRFKERLHRSSLSTYDERCNPFAEEGANPFDEPPVPYRRRKSKKNAPLPPSSSNPDVYLGYKIKGSSKWSLTSSETDYTIDDKSECSADITYYPQSLRECLDNFNKDMDTLNKESLEIGGSSLNILECHRNGQTCDGENENIINSRVRTDSVDEEEIKEINNNETQVLNSTAVIPENTETKTPVIIVTEEYYENSENNIDIDDREEKQNQINIKESEPEIKTYGEEINREHKELTQVECEVEIKKLENFNIELNENSEGPNTSCEIIIIEPEEMKNESIEHSVEANMEEKRNQLNIKESEPEIKTLDEGINREHKELKQVECQVEIKKLENYNIELNENREGPNTNCESIITKPEEMKNVSNEHSVEANISHIEVNGIPEAYKQEEYVVVTDENLRETDMMQKLYIHDVSIEYIDDDNASLHNSEENYGEKSQSQETLDVATTNSKDPSPTHKQRKYKLDKLILLGENSTPK